MSIDTSFTFIKLDSSIKDASGATGNDSSNNWGTIALLEDGVALQNFFNNPSNISFTPPLADVSEPKPEPVVLTNDAYTNSTFIKDYLANRDSYFPPNTWDISKVTDMSGMFLDTSFNEDISNWDVSNVTNMLGMFYDSSFNRDISNWNVSKVTNMAGMFYKSPFNQDINTNGSKWDVSNVTDMTYMFYLSQFNQDISGWNVSNVNNMTGMFVASSFNQDISNWNVSNVTDMTNMFYLSQFNQDISNWNVSNVTDMTYMFYLSQFNQDISNWPVNSDCCFNQMFNNPSMIGIAGMDSSGTPTNYFKSQLFVLTDASANFTFINDYLANPDSYPPPNTWNTSQVTDMSGMFQDTSFNEDISNWDVSNVTNMAEMFHDSSFNRDISNWNVGKVTNMDGMFSKSQFNQDISGWDVSNVTNMFGMFYDSSFNQDISDWETGSVNDMGFMFVAANAFNQDINTNGSKWDVSKVTNMGYMLSNLSFNKDISNWDVSKVTDMVNMFAYSPFNQDISGWNVSNVTDMNFMFFDSSFNQDISNWNVSKVNNTQGMFYKSPFNQDISGWNVSNVNNMFNMFSDSSFNQDISNWPVNSDCSFIQMFNNPSMINIAGIDGSGTPTNYFKSQLFVLTDASANSTFIKDYYLANPDSYPPPNTWDISQVHNMSNLFRDTSFNEDISNWDVSKVTDMNHMFYGSSFNRDIGSWNVRKVTNMAGMFQNNLIFNQDISDWETGSVNDMNYMFYGANAFNKDINTNGSKWDVSKVTDMNHMFMDSSFNQDIGSWDVRKVTNMTGMFQNNRIFNQDISDWETGSVNDMSYMFFGANIFSKDINTNGSKWDVSNVNNMAQMFRDTSFNEDISNWNVSNVNNMIQMFAGSSFNRDISDWPVNSDCSFTQMFNNPSMKNIAGIDSSGTPTNYFKSQIYATNEEVKDILLNKLPISPISNIRTLHLAVNDELRCVLRFTQSDNNIHMTGRIIIGDDLPNDDCLIQEYHLVPSGDIENNTNSLRPNTAGSFSGGTDTDPTLLIFEGVEVFPNAYEAQTANGSSSMLTYDMTLAKGTRYTFKFEFVDAMKDKTDLGKTVKITMPWKGVKVPESATIIDVSSNDDPSKYYMPIDNSPLYKSENIMKIQENLQKMWCCHETLGSKTDASYQGPAFMVCGGAAAGGFFRVEDADELKLTEESFKGSLQFAASQVGGDVNIKPHNAYFMKFDKNIFDGFTWPESQPGDQPKPVVSGECSIRNLLYYSIAHGQRIETATSGTYSIDLPAGESSSQKYLLGFPSLSKDYRGFTTAIGYEDSYQLILTYTPNADSTSSTSSNSNVEITMYFDKTNFDLRPVMQWRLPTANALISTYTCMGATVLNVPGNWKYYFPEGASRNKMYFQPSAIDGTAKNCGVIRQIPNGEAGNDVEVTNATLGYAYGRMMPDQINTAIECCSIDVNSTATVKDTDDPAAGLLQVPPDGQYPPNFSATQLDGVKEITTYDGGFIENSDVFVVDSSNVEMCICKSPLS